MAMTYEDVLALFREVAQAQREAAAAQREVAEARKETERLLREQSQETDRKFQETDRKFQETERLLKEQSQAADRRTKQLNDQLGKLGNRLGEFVEGLVRPAIVRLFQARGITVREVYADVEVEEPDEGMQIDLLAVNGAEAVLVEVKSKLTQADVDEHLERLGKFKRLLPRYAEVRALGAVAAMVVPREVARYAYRQGLYVLAQSGESVVILNDTKFQPRAW